MSLVKGQKVDKGGIVYVSLADAARECRYTQEYLSLRARQGKLKSIKRGRNWYTTRQWLLDYLSYCDNLRKENGQEGGPPRGVGLPPTPSQKIEQEIVQIQSFSPVLQKPEIKPNFWVLLLLGVKKVSNGLFSAVKNVQSVMVRETNHLLASIKSKSKAATKLFIELLTFSNVWYKEEKNRLPLRNIVAGLTLIISVFSLLNFAFGANREEVRVRIGAVIEDSVKFSVTSARTGYLAVGQAKNQVFASLDDFSGRAFDYFVKTGELSNSQLAASYVDVIQQKGVAVLAGVNAQIPQRAGQVGIAVLEAPGQTKLAAKNLAVGLEKGVKRNFSDLSFGFSLAAGRLKNDFNAAVSDLAMSDNGVNLSLPDVKKIAAGVHNFSAAVQDKIFGLRDIAVEGAFRISQKVSASPRKIALAVSRANQKVTEFLFGDFAPIDSNLIVLRNGKNEIIASGKKEIVREVSKIVQPITEITKKETVKVIEKVNEINRITETFRPADYRQDLNSLELKLLAALAETKNSLSQNLSHLTGYVSYLPAPSGPAYIQRFDSLEDITFNGYINQTASEQVTFNGNVDAKNGLDVSNGNFTVSGTGFTIDTSGNVSGIGTSSFGTTTLASLTVSNNATTTGNFYIGNALAVAGNSTFGNASADNVTFNSRVASDFIPASDNVYDLGTSSLTWRSLYVGPGSVNVYNVRGSDSEWGFLDFSGNVFRLGTARTGAGAGRDLALVSSSSEAVRIAVSGNVGIGTTTVGSLLHLSKQTAADTDLRFESQGYNWIMGIDNSDAGKFKISSSTALGTSDRLTIDGNGNVGIGTTSPSSKLAVAGGAYFDGGTITASGFIATSTLTVQSTTATSTFSTGGFTIGTSQFVVQQSSGNVGIGTTTPGNLLSVYSSSAATAGFSGGAGKGVWSLGYDVSNNYFAIASSSDITSNVRMVINNDGNVGIGTTTPASLLNIASTLPRFYLSDTDFATNGHWFMENDAGVFSLGTTSSALAVSGTRALSIKNDGNVGIGTTNPVHKLDVYGATGNTILGVGDIPNVGAPLLYMISAASGYFTGSAEAVIQTRSNHPLAFGINDAEKMRITTGGNLGIGTTSPNQKLTIFNNAADSALEFSSASGDTYKWVMGMDYSDAGKFKISSSTALGTSDRLVIDGNGNVGIGTTSPFTALGVVGTSTLQDIIPGSNLRYNLGTSALRYNAGWFGSLNIGTSTWSVLNSADGRLSFFDQASGAGNERLTILRNGNFGIGTTSPAQLLSVSGSGYFTGGLGVGVATTSAGVLETSGDIWVGGNLRVSGAGTIIGGLSSDTLTVNASINSNLIPDQNAARDIGSSSYYWDDVYVDNLVANNISAASTTIAGTQSATFTLNSDNATADTENQDLIFFRGTVVPNALLSWKSAIDRFEFNQPLFIKDASLTGATSTLLVQGWSGQTGDIFRVASSSSENNSYLNVTAAGNVGIGTTTPSNLLSVYSSSAATAGFSGGAGKGVWSLGYDVSNNYFAIASSSSITSNVKMVINNDGNVGIGTTSPSSKLAVAGGAYFDGGTITASGFIATSTLTVQSTTATSTFSTGGFTIGTSQFVVQQSSGNVGIGTTGPGAKLDVSGTTRIIGQGTPASGAGVEIDYAANSGRVLSYDRTGVAYKELVLQGANINLQIAGVAGQGLFVNTTGNVGIGTTSPQGILETWNGRVRFAANGDLPAAPASGKGLELFYDGSATDQGVVSAYDRTAGTPKKLYISGSPILLMDGNVGIGTTSPLAKLAIKGTGATTGRLLQITDSGDVEKVTILDNGNVGIGTTTPNSLLSLYQASADTGLSFGNSNATMWTMGTDISDGSKFKISSSSALGTNDRLTIDTNGNVGIGTTTPASLLNIASTLPRFYLSDTDFATNGHWFMENDAGVFSLGTTSSALAVSGTRALSIKNDGNVGIGTTSPSSKLSIKGGGTGTGRAFVISDSGDVEKVTILDNGNVGIGTTTPGNLLSVYSSSAATAGFSGGAGKGVWSLGYDVSNNYFAIASSSSITSNVKMVINNDGNVGIGTTNPGAKLVLATTQENGDAFNWLTFRNLQANYGTWSMAKSGNNDLVFNYGTNTDAPTVGTALTLQYNGNVGIGTTTPGNLLSVYSSSAATAGFSGGAGKGVWSLGYDVSNNYFAIASSSDITSNVRMVINNDGNVGIGTTTPASLLNIASTLPRFYLSDTDFATNGHWFMENNAGVFSLGTTSSALAVSGTRALSIKNDGNVGIGTTSPLAKLAIKGTGATTGRLLQITDSGDVEKVTILDNGNVGIGTTTPNSLLSLYQASADTGLSFGNSNATMWTMGTDISDGSKFKISSSSALGTNDRLTIDTNGNVGIGTTTPGVKLDVWGTAGANDIFNVASSTGTSVLRIDKNGNVGIGTTTPASLLNIASTLPRFYLSDTDFATNGHWFMENDAGVFSLGTTSSALAVSGTRALSIKNDGNVGIGTTTPGTLLHVAKANDDAYIIMQRTGTSASSYSVGTQATGFAIYDQTAVSTRLAIDSSGNVSIPVGTLTVSGTGNSSIAGNVGIGTTSPSSKLSIKGGGTGTGRAFVISDSGDVEKVTILDNGNVGIGTTTPGNLLSVYSSSAATAGFSGGAGKGVWSLGYDVSNNYFAIASSSSITSNVKMVINNDGNVGIGTTTPFGKFAITSGGASTARGFSFADSNNLDRFYINDRGDITINAGGAGSELDIRTVSGPAELLFSAGGTLHWDIYDDSTDSNKFKITDGSNTFVTIVDNGTTGNVGIGTTSPSSKLAVAGGAYFDGGTITASGFIATSTLTVQSTTATSTFSTGGFTIGTSQFVVQQSSGNVGIGTTTVGSLLHLSKQTAADTDLRFESQGYNWIMGIDNSDAGKFKISSSTALGTSDRLTIDGNGNVGIGTTTPSQKLTVSGTGVVQSRIESTSSGGSRDARLTLFINNQGGDDPAGSIYFNSLNGSGVEGTAATIFTTTGSGGGGNGQLYFQTANSGTLYNRMTITNAGNVGIGTTTVGSLLHLSKQTAADTDLRFESQGYNWIMGIDNSDAGKFKISSSTALGTSDRLTIDGNGNVGIGTTSPSSKLAVAGGAYFDGGTITASGFIATSTLTVQSTTATSTFSTGGFTIGTSQFVVQQSSGNVGIGTTGPNRKLDIRGSSGAIDIFVGESDRGSDRGWDTTADYSYWTTSSYQYPIWIDGSVLALQSQSGGNVGIGTTTPNSLLSLYQASADTGLSFGNSNATMWTMGTDISDGSKFKISSSSALGTNDRLTIDTNGNVGIGTTTPASLLNIASTLPRFYLSDTDFATNGHWFMENDAGVFSLGTTSSALAVSNTRALSITNTGNVGIGTTSPSSKLAVAGGAYFDGGTITASGIIATSTLTVQSTTATSTFSTGGFTIGTSQFVVQQSSGNVGIGTTTPLSKLSLYNASADADLAFGDTNATRFTIGTDYSDSSKFKFSASAALGTNDRLTITTDGNVGIGTTSPSSKLAVAGGAYFDGGTITASGFIATSTLTVQSTTATSTFSTGGFTIGTSQFVVQQSSGNVGIGTTNPVSNIHPGTPKLIDMNGGANTPALVFHISGTAQEASVASGGNGLYLDAVGHATALGNNVIVFRTTDVNSSYAVKERVRIDSNGNVGIGTTTPGNLLSVYSSSAATAGFSGGAGKGVWSLGYDVSNNYFAIASSSSITSNVKMVINNDGNVGIGTTSPQGILETWNGRVRFAANGDLPAAPASGKGLELFYDGSATDQGVVSAYDRTAGTPKKLYISGSPILLMDGNVGIGTTAPGVKLDVQGVDAAPIDFRVLKAGSASARSFLGLQNLGYTQWRMGINGYDLYFGNANDTEQKVTFQNAGNVGIGTTSPSSKLAVAGGAYFDGGTITASGFIATSTLTVQSTTATSTFSTGGFTIGTSQFVVQQSSGNVGIGTTSPSSKLAVAGGAYFDGGTITASGFIATSTLTVQSTTATSTFSTGGFTIGTSQFVVQQSSGNVGIGATSPGNKLSVAGGNISVDNTLSVGGADGNGLRLSTEYATDARAVFLKPFVPAGAAGIDYAGLKIITNNGTVTPVEAMTFLPSGNVGIGTTTPAAKLDIYSDGSLAGLRVVTTGTNAAYGYYRNNNYAGGSTLLGVEQSAGGGLFTGSSAYASVFGNAANYPVQFATNNSVKVTISTDGNVGIGTTEPLNPLHIVANSANTGLRLERTSATTGTYDIGLRSTGNLYIAEAAVGDRIEIEKTTGNVGIGTTTPGAKLSVAGTGLFGSTAYAALSNGVLEAQITSAGTALGSQDALSIINRQAVATDVNAELSFRGTTGGNIMGAIRGAWTGATTAAGGYISLATRQVTTETLTERVRIDQTGNVGIGTTTPGTLLHVAKANDDAYIIMQRTGTSASSYSVGTQATGFAIYDQTAVSTRLAIDSSGNVSIPVGTLTVSGTGNSSIAGNVGIGTTSPSSKLAVAGGAYFDGGTITASGFIATSTLTVQSTTATSTFSTGGFTIGTSQFVVQQSSGNVGIGTTSPASKFNVYGGDAYFDGGTTAIRVRNDGDTAYRGDFNMGTTDGLTINAYKDGAGAGYLPISLNSTTFSVLTGAGGATQGLYQNTDGNVGIGTTSPTKLLSLAEGQLKIDHTGTTGNKNLIEMTRAGANTWLMYFTGAGKDLSFYDYNGGGDSLYLKSGGNVGIGTTSPSSKLAVAGGAYFDGGTITASGFIATSTLTVQSTTATSTFSTGGFTIGTSQFVVQQSSGNVGIGTTGPGAKLHILNNVDGISEIRFDNLAGGAASTNEEVSLHMVLGPDGSSTSGGVKLNAGKEADFQVAGDKDAYFSIDVLQDNAYNERFRIQSNGNVGIGTTSPATALDVNGTITQTNQKSCANGLTTNALGSINGCAASDASLKTDVNPASYSALPIIAQLSPVSYKWRNSSLKDALLHSGFIAQDIEAVFPTAVVGGGFDEFGNAMKAVDPNAMASLLAKGIQELNAKTEALGSGFYITDSEGEVIFSRNSEIYPSQNREMTLSAGLIILDGGGVGIGTTTPAARLEVWGNSSSTPSALFMQGNVGIGVASPSYNLEVAGEAAAHAFVNISTREAKKDIVYLNDLGEEDILRKIASTSVATYQYNSDRECALDSSSPQTRGGTEGGVILNSGLPPFAPSSSEEGRSCRRMGLIAEEAPREVLSADQKGVDIYKMTSFLWMGVKAQQKQIDKLTQDVEEIKLQLGSRGEINSLNPLLNQEGAPSLILREGWGELMNAFASIGVIFEKGIAKFESLFTKSLTIEKPVEPEQATIGEGKILAGQTEALIQSSAIATSSKIFITFRGDYGSRWWIEKKGDGLAVVKIAEPLSADIEFDWWIVGVQEPEINTEIMDINEGANSAVSPLIESQTAQEDIGRPVAEIEPGVEQPVPTGPDSTSAGDLPSTSGNIGRPASEVAPAFGSQSQGDLPSTSGNIGSGTSESVPEPGQ